MTLQTLKGTITAVIGVLTLLTTLVLTVQGFRDAAAKFLASLGLEGKPVPVNFVAKYPKVVPLSLWNTINYSTRRPDWLYWVSLKAVNKSNKTAHIDVTFLLADLAAPLGNPRPYDVEPGKSLTTWPNPTSRLMNMDVWQSLGVNWKATIPGQPNYKQGTTEPPIRVLPRAVIDWDLETPEGTQAPPEFLLAWLRAWIKTAETETQNDIQLQKNMVKLIDAPIPKRARGWMEACYNRFFTGSTRIVVDPKSQPLPGHEKQEIHDATRLLHDRFAGALEAALLMAGASRKFLPGDRVDLALFGLPSGQNADSGKILLLGWRPPGDAWRAIEINRASQFPFTANEEQATGRLNALFAAEKPLLETLDKEGCYVRAESPIVALDLVKRDKPYLIYGLP